MRIRAAALSLALLVSASSSFLQAAGAQAGAPGPSAAVYPQSEGFVDAHGVLVYWKSVGRGAPLFVV